MTPSARPQAFNGLQAIGRDLLLDGHQRSHVPKVQERFHEHPTLIGTADVERDVRRTAEAQMELSICPSRQHATKTTIGDLESCNVQPLLNI